MKTLTVVVPFGIMKPPNRNIAITEKSAEDAATDGFRNTEASKRNIDIDT